MVAPMPPDNTRPPRSTFQPPPLGVRPLAIAIEEIARAKRLDRPRVTYSQTEQGEHCVALIFPGWRRHEED
jgi:hypothetical protein